MLYTICTCTAPYFRSSPSIFTLFKTPRSRKNSPLFDSRSIQSAFVNLVSLHSAQTTSDPDGIGHWDLRRIRADDRTETTRDANHDGSSEAPRPRNKCWLINHLVGRHGEKRGCPELPSGAAWRAQLQLRLVITHLPGSLLKLTIDPISTLIGRGANGHFLQVPTSSGLPGSLCT